MWRYPNTPAKGRAAALGAPERMDFSAFQFLLSIWLKNKSIRQGIARLGAILSESRPVVRIYFRGEGGQARKHRLILYFLTNVAFYLVRSDFIGGCQGAAKEHTLRTTIITSSARTLDLVTLLMMQTARVKSPAGEAASRRAASVHRRQCWRQMRHECSSRRALRCIWNDN